jgi:DNA polymerase-3 subunit alpha
MQHVFGDHPEAIANTLRIAERCHVEIPKGAAHLPDFVVPGGYTLESYFEHVVREGFAERLPRLRVCAAEGLLRYPLSEYEARLTY